MQDSMFWNRMSAPKQRQVVTMKQIVFTANYPYWFLSLFTDSWELLRGACLSRKPAVQIHYRAVLAHSLGDDKLLTTVIEFFVVCTQTAIRWELQRWRYRRRGPHENLLLTHRKDSVLLSLKLRIVSRRDIGHWQAEQISWTSNAHLEAISSEDMRVLLINATLARTSLSLHWIE